MIALLNSQWESQILFAAEQLGKVRASRAVSPLINALDAYTDAENICAVIIHSLGRIQDERAFSVLERYASSRTGILQEEALLALSRFSRGRYHRKYIARCIDSTDPRVREIAFSSVFKKQDALLGKVYCACIRAGGR